MSNKSGLCYIFHFDYLVCIQISFTSSFQFYITNLAENNLAPVLLNGELLAHMETTRIDHEDVIAIQNKSFKINVAGGTSEGSTPSNRTATHSPLRGKNTPAAETPYSILSKSKIWKKEYTLGTFKRERSDCFEQSTGFGGE